MANGKNRTEIIGNLTDDPEIKYFDSGKVLTKFSVAVNEYQGQNSPELVTYFSVEVWGQKAEYIAEYAKKGGLVSVEGSLRIEKYQKQDGTSGQKTYIKLKEFWLLRNKD